MHPAFFAAVALLLPGSENASEESQNWARNDPDLDPVRDYPRFKALMSAVEARLAQGKREEK